MNSNKREPLLAFVFSVLMTGLGQLYIGQARKCILLVVLQASIIFIFAVTGYNSTLYGFWLFITLMISVHAYSAISAFIVAYNQRSYSLKKYNRSTYYVGSWLFFAILSELILSARGTILGYESYQIPSGSMTPTISIGDYILVDTRSKSPRVGDVIVYKNNGISYVKRVAAIETDKISISGGNIILNDKNIGNLSAASGKTTEEYSLTMNEITIDRGEIFLLGDNRDYSNDSRFTGSISSTQIIGTVTGIWLSKDISRIGQKIQ